MRGKLARVRTEAHKSSNNCVQVEALKADDPVVLGSAIDKNESKPVPQTTETITKGNIKVDSIQIFGRERKGSPAWTFGQRCEFTKAGGGIAALNKLEVFGSEAKLFIITKASVTKEVVYLIRGEVAERVGPIRSIAGTHQRRVVQGGRKK